MKGINADDNIQVAFVKRAQGLHRNQAVQPGGANLRHISAGTVDGSVQLILLAGNIALAEVLSIVHKK